MQKMFGFEFSPMSEDELVLALSNRMPSSAERPRSIVTANVDHVVQLRRNPEFREAYANAWQITIDGTPVFLYAKLKGLRRPFRVTGSDLVPKLLPNLPPNAARCFFIASNSATVERLNIYLRSRGFPPDAVGWDVPPFGFEHDPDYSTKLADRIREHGTTHLFVGVGSPKSEIWAHRHCEALGSCYVLNIGASLDFVVGTARRAPVWVQRIGFEWFWRFAQEPRRLYRRYFIDSWAFLAAMRDDLKAGHS
jgi:N-acetylglucosaminyldiphosphoundecaprenol N-acetyl-beta-D-mannosaminyltransferase